MSVCAKAFICLSQDQQFTNHDQKEILRYQMRTVLPRIGNYEKGSEGTIESSNGTWVYKASQKQLCLLLTSKQASQASRSSLLNRLASITSTASEHQDSGNIRKLRSSVAQALRSFNVSNSNSVRQATSNVTELQDSIRGNLSKIITNVSELQEVERKSERLSQMSLTFQGSARELQKTMARKRMLIRVITAVIVVLVLALLLYIVF